MDEMKKLAEGCKWYQEHPECFELYDNGFKIRVAVDERTIPECALFYVNYCNERVDESRVKRDALGLGTKRQSREGLPRIIKWGK